MSIGTGLFLLLIAAILVAAGAGLTSIINRNFTAGQRVRGALLDRINMLRLARMLKKRGISTGGYLHDAAMHDIETTIRNCENCGKLKVCDTALETPAVGIRDLSFCANDNALKKYNKAPEQVE